MAIISWMVFGLIAGVIAKFIVGGDFGILTTIVLGVVGAVIGGWIAAAFGGYGVTGFNVHSFFVAVLGAIVVLFVFTLFSRKRTA